MIDFVKARSTMVDCQLRPNGVSDYAVLGAFAAVRREAFAPSRVKPFAYSDEDLRLSGLESSRYLLEPVTLARMVQEARIGPGDIVLDVGCATGYSTAILAILCNSVVALESDETLAAEATRILAEEGVANAAVVTGPLEKGYAKEAPYDAILVNGSVGDMPDALKRQLKPGGRLVAVEGVGNAGKCWVYVGTQGGASRSEAFNAAVPALPGFEREAGFVF